MSDALTMALDIVERIDGSSSVDDACRSYFNAVKALGARSIIVQDARVQSLPLTDTGEFPYIFASTPTGWVGSPEAAFIDKNNPNPAACMRLGRPFRWREAQLSNRKLGGAYWEALGAHGGLDGLCIPVFDSRICVAGVSMAFGRSEFDPRERRAIEVASYALMERVQRITRDERFRRPPLSPRERDCLAFVAAGKSEWEISVILSISRATVHTHVENAKMKLDSRSRAQAVAQALTLGLI